MTLFLSTTSSLFFLGFCCCWVFFFAFNLVFPGSAVLYLAVGGRVVRELLDSSCFTARCQFSRACLERNGIKTLGAYSAGDSRNSGYMNFITEAGV